jgi:hypothetical protein
MFEFKNVTESSRTYHYSDGKCFTIKNVRKVYVKPDTGTHRIEDDAGTKWIVPTGWVAIEFNGEWVF